MDGVHFAEVDLPLLQWQSMCSCIKIKEMLEKLFMMKMYTSNKPIFSFLMPCYLNLFVFQHNVGKKVKEVKGKRYKRKR